MQYKTYLSLSLETERTKQQKGMVSPEVRTHKSLKIQGQRSTDFSYGEQEDEEQKREREEEEKKQK